MDGCHAVEITSFFGIDGKFPLSVPKQPELKNHQINMAKSSMQSAKIIATTQRNATQRECVCCDGEKSISSWPSFVAIVHIDSVPTCAFVCVPRRKRIFVTRHSAARREKLDRFFSSIIVTAARLVVIVR